MSGVDKFVWLRAVFGQPEFTAGEKAVLAHIAVFNVMAGRDTFRVRQSTIAENSGITRRTVNAAIQRGKRLKYLTLADAREPGWGRSGADEIRLILPETREVTSHDSGESREKQMQKSCEANAESREKQMQKSCEAPNSPTCENDTPNSSLEQFSENSSSTQVQRTEPEPDVWTPAPEVRGQERGRSDPVNVSASRLVSDLVPVHFPAAFKNSLRRQASALIVEDQLPSEVVAESIRRLLAKPDAGVGLLPHIAAQVLREGTAPAPKSKARTVAEWTREARAQERAEQPDRKALEQ
jgi:hypothetical protein